MQNFDKFYNFIHYRRDKIGTIHLKKSEENQVPCFGVLGNLILSFSKLLNQKATLKPSAQHVLDEDYYKRIEAIQFTMMHDDGKKTEDMNDANIILLGISRTGKPPHPYIWPTGDLRL